jgi:hypothetical protein
MNDGPYRAANAPPAARPIEFDARLLSLDFANGPVAPFTSIKGADVEIEAAMPGARMRGVATNNWLRSVQLGDYEVPDFGVRVVSRLEGEPNGMVRIWFRHFRIGAGQVGYSITIRPLLRQYRVVRYAGNEVDPLVDWSTSQHIAGPGVRNVVEIGVRRDQIMVVCNDQMITFLNDASFSRGAVSIGATGATPRDMIVFDAIDLWTVHPS